MPGLFSIFNTAKSGLFSQQTAIDVTSHNIANADTDGYSRQRANLVTTTPYTMPSMDSAAVAGQLGTGVTVASIDRIRDSFLDYQIRAETGISGKFTARDKYLSQVEDILNEPTDTGLSTLVSNFFSAWQDFTASPQNGSTVAQQAYQLTNELNNISAQLTNVKENTTTEIKNVVVNVNSLIKQISDLNQQIKDVNSSGDNPNDLMDKRDLLLDQLSSEFGIDVEQRKYDGIDVTTTNDALQASEDDDGNPPVLNGKSLNIVQSDNPYDTNVATFSYVSSITRTTDADADGKATYSVVYYKKGDMLTDANKVTINVTMTEDEAGELEKDRVLWADSEGTAYSVGDGKVVDGTLANDSAVDFDQLALFKPPSGELKGYMSVQDDVSEYQDKLDKFAKAFALSVNAVISQSSTFQSDNVTDGTAEGGINNFFVNGDQSDPLKYSEDDENAINASNITLNVEILNDPSKIKIATKYDSEGNSLGQDTDTNRALAVAQLANSLMNIQSITQTSSREDLVGEIFNTDSTINNVYSVGSVTGGNTLNNYFDDIVNRVGVDENEAKNAVSTEADHLQSYQQVKESNSGVSIDEEMTNLIQFEHCYQANAKMISTVNDLLDVVINGLKK